MIDIPRSKFSQEYEYLDQDNKSYRKTSFSIIKHTTYSKTEDAIDVADRLEGLKHDKFSGRIKIPYFEFKLEDNNLTIQSKYIKGRPLVKEEMKHIYENIVCRTNPWTFLDCNPDNFVVDDHKLHFDGKALIYIVDLDSYKKCDKEEREKRWAKNSTNFRSYRVDI